MSDPSATIESAITYSIQYDPDGSELPRIPRKPLLCLPWLKRPGKARYRPLHAKFIVGAAHQVVYNLKVEHDLHFNASAQGTLRIELYAKHRDSDVLIASKECALAPPTIFQDPVRLDIQDKCLSESPMMRLKVTLPVIDENFEAVIDANKQLLSVSDCLDDILQFSKMAIKIGGALGELLPVSQSVFALLELGVDALEERVKFHEDIRALVEELRDACQRVKGSEDHEFKSKQTEYRKACNALTVEIFRVSSFLRSLTDMNLAQRSRSKINERVQEMRERLRKLAEYVKSGGELDMQNSMFRVESMMSKFDNESTLGHLPIAKGMQAGSSKGCLPNTRTHLLTEIMDWAFDQNGARCFLLHGAAGMGKSAVAHSVARILADTGDIIAPFFAFDRNEASRQAHQLYPTLAENLARYDRQYLESLHLLHSDQLKTIDILDQHKNLMLSLLQSTPSVPIVFVVDALDECPDAGRKFLLNSLRACVTDNSSNRRVRFFMTTRPDKDICETLPSESELHVWKPIDDIHGTTDDIRLYVASQLANTKVSSIIDVVATASQAHFECAAVLCRELTDARKPRTAAERKQFIEDIRNSPGKPLYNTYRTVLSKRLTDSWMPIYRRALAWVLAARDPQPLSVFLDFAESFTAPSWREDLAEVLTGLGSLLAGARVGDNTPIRPLHTSFRDYVLDAEASGVFAIASEFDAADSQLALACFSIMGRPESGLRYNICDLPSPFIYKEDVDSLDGRLTEHVSPALRYACREVSVHLSRCENPDEAPGLVSALKGFLQDRFLFWVEACGWLGNEPCDVLQDMLKWAETHDGDNSAPLVSDFISFAKRYREAILRSPPQVYITGLLFAPVDSLVSRLYRTRITSPIEISGFEQEREWPPGETLVIQARSTVFSVAYSPDGAKIGAGLYDNTLRLWDAATGRQVGGAMRGHTDSVSSVAFSPDGSRIVSGSRDHTVRLWDAKTGEQKGEVLHGHTDWVLSVAFSPNDATVVSGSADSTLRLWNAQTGKEMGNALEGHTDWVHSIVFSHDGTRIISGADDETVRIWDIATHQQLGDPIQHEGLVMSVAISRDGKQIASGSSYGDIRVWDVEGRQPVWALRGHEGRVYAVAFSPDSTRVVSGGSDDTVRIWEAASGKQVGDDLRSHTNGASSVAFSPNGKHVASGFYATTIRVWDVRQVKRDGVRPVGHAGAVTSIACSSDGKYIVSGSHDKTVRLWDASTGQPVGDPMMGHDGDVECVTFSPDRTRIASASDDSTVRVWDVTTRQLVGDALDGHDYWALCVAFSPDGTRLLSGSADGTLRLWDLATGQQIGEPLSGHGDRVQSVSFSRDGLCIASGFGDGTIQSWDAQFQPQAGKVMKGHDKWVRSLAFSPDDAFLASGSDDRTIRLWDTHTGEQMGEPLTGHSGYVLFVSFSLDGNYIVSGSEDRTVRVWNVQTRQQVGIALRGHKDWINSVSLTADGTHIVSGSDDGTIRVWDFGNLLSLENSVDDAIASPTRALVQSFLQENEDCWLIFDDNGTERPILWIPHHLRHMHRVHSPFHVQFVPPTTPQMHIRLNESFHLDKWPTYTPAPAAEESLAALGREE